MKIQFQLCDSTRKRIKYTQLDSNQQPKDQKSFALIQLSYRCLTLKLITVIKKLSLKKKNTAGKTRTYTHIYAPGPKPDMSTNSTTAAGILFTRAEFKTFKFTLKIPLLNKIQFEDSKGFTIKYKPSYQKEFTQNLSKECVNKKNQ